LFVFTEAYLTTCDNFRFEGVSVWEEEERMVSKGSFDKIQGCGRNAVMPNLRAAYEIL
jgi:hypothetical protein